MPGILDFLKNPKVQDAALSVGGALAFGANPILGLLAAPLVHDQREKTRLSNETTREAIVGLKAENRGRERAEAALNNLPSVLSPGAPLTQEGRRAEILKSAGALAPGEVGAGLASQVFPPERASTGILATAEALMAADPQLTLPDALKQAATYQSSADPNTALETQKLLAELGLAQVNLRKAEDEETTKKTGTVSTATNVLNVATSALDHNQKLRGTLLESGSIGPNLPRIALSGMQLGTSLFGTKEQAENFRSMVTTLDLFKKDITDLNVQVVSMLENANVSLSNNFRQSLQDASANVSVDPEANQAIIFRILGRSLDLAESQGADIPELRSMQDQLRQKYTGDPIDTYLNTIEGYSQMGPAERTELRSLIEKSMREAK